MSADAGDTAPEAAPTPSGASRTEELVFVGVILAYCAAYVVQVADLPFHSTGYPLILVAALVVMLALIAWRTLRQAPVKTARPAPQTFAERLIRLRGAILAITAFCFPFAATRLGFLAALFLAMLIAIRLVSGIGWVKSAAAAALSALAVTTLLLHVLGLSLTRFPFLTLPFGY
ncbi:tripartite tricarboxylate transporter TctB family protein [Acuticoccus kandeliae]|uniref:tripartite tricarboxylate transporter TctB family protein n=1 Tax=Acuticoccus kandeliae TaxID=2073160 RepID=UPI000D3E8EDC|nr:tripartite tricarboxylate transporter TctB family protein [Acuticoccus kandeliae]